MSTVTTSCVQGSDTKRVFDEINDLAFIHKKEYRFDQVETNG